MSTIAGAFDETILNDIRVRADEVLFNDRIKQQFNPEIELFKAVQAVQTAKVNPLFSRLKNNDGSNKRYDVEIEWINTCDIDVEDNTTCEIGGTKTSTNLETYSLSYEKVVNFSVDEADLDDNDFDVQENIAKALVRADKQLLEDFVQTMVARLNGFAGSNTLSGGKGVDSSGDTYILPSYWDATLMAYFNRVAIDNKFTSPTLVSGQNLYEQIWVAAANAGNANGKGDPMMYGSMPIYFDLRNIDSVNSTDLITYMLSMDSLALANVAYNSPKLEVVHNVFTRWQENSKFVPGIKYDMFYKAECTTNDRIQHNFKVKLNADLFNNPAGCDANNTGVLRFFCGSTS